MAATDDLLARFKELLDESPGTTAKALLGAIDARSQEFAQAESDAKLREALTEEADKLPGGQRQAARKFIDDFFQEARPAGTAPGSGGGSGDGQTRGERRAAWLGSAAVGLILFSFLVIIGVFVFDSSRLTLLGDIAIARGLITFLITIGVIGVAVVIIAALFLGSAIGLKDRFSGAKEILTALIAVLGTIVGFYFGSDDGPDRPELAIAAPALSATAAAPGASVLFATSVSGGQPPYDYAITLRSTAADAESEPIGTVVGEGADGLIARIVVIPADGLDLPASLGLTVTVTDAAGQTVQSEAVPLLVQGGAAGGAPAPTASPEPGASPTPAPTDSGG